jgi:hypothetical protein
MRLRHACLALLAGLLAPVPARGGVDALLSAAGWRELRFARLDPNRFLGDGGAVVIESERSVSMLWRAADHGEQATGRLVWRWCVEGNVPSTDLRRRGGDDRAAILYIGFADMADQDDELASFARAYERSPLAGTVLGYVWGGAGADGWVDDPWLPARGRFRTLAPAAARGCREEAVNLAADYTAAFGKPMPAVAAIALGADTDDTGSWSRIRIELLGAAGRP